MPFMQSAFEGEEHRSKVGFEELGGFSRKAEFRIELIARCHRQFVQKRAGNPQWLESGRIASRVRNGWKPDSSVIRLVHALVDTDLSLAVAARASQQAHEARSCSSGEG